MPRSNDDLPGDRPWDRDDDDRSRRRERDRDDYDDRPRRGRDRDDSGKSSGVLVVLAVLGGMLLLCVPLAILLLFPAVQKVREAAARVKDSNNLKQIAIGLHNYADSNKTELPPAQDQVSWRVHLLPFVEQEAMYRQFNMKEPWDGPTNKRFASQSIPQYTSTGGSTTAGDTHYRVFVGPNTLYPQSRSPFTIRSVKDGTGNTFFAVEASEAVPWSQPRELEYDPTGPLPQLGLSYRKGFLVMMMDGSVRFVSDKTSPDVIRGGIEPADGRLFPLE